MIIIEGFEPAKLALSRTPMPDLHLASRAARERMREIFGTDLDNEQAVGQIIDGVRERGDAALLDYTLRIDHVELTSLEITEEQMLRARRGLGSELAAALELAAERIRAFHTMQWHALEGFSSRGDLGWMVRPIERIGIYVPGGTAGYPSTALMTAIPARVAGVRKIIMVTPPGPDGTVPSATLAAAAISGVDRVFSVGGAQAIAALAFGTESIPRVDKICGPGNIFVVLAKKLVYGAVDIDGLQGPSEVLIIADGSADAALCAADLLAQAEHDPMASAIMVTTSRHLARDVNREVERQMTGLPRQAVITEALASRGVIAVVDTVDEALELANLYAPEHLSLMVEKAATYAPRVTNAGAVFVGPGSPVVLGDYVAGPSHALPTSGTARFGSPLSVLSFLKFINIENLSAPGLGQLIQATAAIARAEGFEAHARAAEKRLK